jgi:glycine/D-amino acid oxidase-like deaminating enzyme
LVSRCIFAGLNTGFIKDYLIVGQGLAGSVLATELLNKGFTVCVADLPSQNTSSSVAAGIFNPITGKRLALAENANLFFDSTQNYFQNQQQQHAELFYNPMPIFKVISSHTEMNNLTIKLGQPSYQAFLQEPNFQSLSSNQYRAPHGALAILRGGWVNIPVYLNAVRHGLQQLDSYLPNEVKESDLLFEDHFVTWKGAGITARKVVFCTGQLNKGDWGYTNWMAPMKGEILTVEIPQLDQDKIVVGGCFICPLGHNRFRVGSTYDWANINLSQTETAQTDLLTRLGKIIHFQPKVIDHKVGIRPSVKDRNPVVGQYKNYKNAFILNGLGSKGVSQVSHVVHMLMAFMEDEQALPPNLNVSRFNKVLA